MRKRQLTLLVSNQDLKLLTCQTFPSETYCSHLFMIVSRAVSSKKFPKQPTNCISWSLLLTSSITICRYPHLVAMSRESRESLRAFQDFSKAYTMTCFLLIPLPHKHLTRPPIESIRNQKEKL